MNAFNEVRRRIGAAVFERVAGTEGSGRRERIHSTAAPRWFADDAAIRVVHGDASMFVGGLRALLLQSLHPLAMAGVAGHSGYRGDPWGRLQRTSYFLAVTTFGPAADAEAAVAQVRAVHERVRGAAADGRRYAASDPRLLRWVHVAEADSFLRAHTVYGATPLDQPGRDRYVREIAHVGEKLGVIDPPRTEAELAAELEDFRQELAATPEARSAARFLLLHPPLPALARAPYAVLGAAAVALMPTWARRPLGLPYLPAAEHTLVRLAGEGAVRTIRWAMRPPQPSTPAELDAAS